MKNKTQHITILCLALFIAFISKVHAQNDSTIAQSKMSRWENNLSVGFNFGGSAPVPFPNTIRKIDAYWPAFAPAVGYERLYHFNKKWSIGASLTFEVKGMGTRAEVLYQQTIITTDDGGTFQGIFSGKNETKVFNTYFTLPVYAVYDIDAHWRVKLGLYAACIVKSSFKGSVSDGYIRNGGPLGEKVDIDHATFDFSKNENKFDWGLHAGGERTVGKKLAVAADFNYGLRPLFPSSFTGMDFSLYNIYLTLGVRYRL